MSEYDSNSVGVTCAGVAVAIGVGGLLVTVRDVIGNTNVALVLVVVIVAAAAFGGRRAGVVTAGAACLTFNFFHTQPLHSLRIHSSKDIWTVALLFTIGLAVGQLAVFARNTQTKSVIDRAGVAHLEKIGAMVAEDQPLTSVWPAIRTALLDELTLADATFEPGEHADSSMDVLERSGRFDNKVMFWHRSGMELPRDGIALPVRAGTRSFGRIVLAPNPGKGTTRDQRRVAVALSDLLAVTIDRHPPTESELQLN
jgi:K+-sensing histidine kinase KdpD